jgi:hypothetical protein
MCREVFTALRIHPRRENLLPGPLLHPLARLAPGAAGHWCAHPALPPPLRPPSSIAAARDAQRARAVAVRICVLLSVVLLVFGVTARSGAGPSDACRLETFSEDEQCAALPVRLYSSSSSDE